MADEKASQTSKTPYANWIPGRILINDTQSKPGVNGPGTESGGTIGGPAPDLGSLANVAEGG